MKSRNRILKNIISILLVVALCMPNMNFGNKATVVNAATQTLERDDIATEVMAPEPVNFLNGSFELPKYNTKNVYYATYNELTNAVGQLNWQSRPADPMESIDKFEYWVLGAYDVYPPEGMGNQFIELNAYKVNTVYQNCATDTTIYTLDINGNKVSTGNTADRDLYYEFYHRGRAGTDVMDFLLGKETDKDSDLTKIRTCADGTTWQRYYGIYTVPADQNRTQFAFQSVSSSDGKGGDGGKAFGNFLDGIRLYTAPYLVMDKTVSTNADDNSYALIDEIITYTVTIKNCGESTSSNTVFTDVMPDGVEFQADSVTLNGNAAGTAANYNSTSETLTVDIPNIGYNDTTTLTYKVKVTGNKRTTGDKIENQANVSYNGEGFEYVQNDDGTLNMEKPIAKTTHYSTIADFILKSGSITGTVWIDKDNGGTISTGERKASDFQVSIVDKDGNVIKDVNGNNLTATPNTTTGVYKFTAIPLNSTYNIQVTAPGYKITKPSTADDGNKAETSNADEGIFRINSKTFTDENDKGKDYENQNFGILPIMTVEKTASVDGGTAAKGTEAAPIRITEDNTLTYTIKITNHATNEADTISNVTITDTIPDKLDIDSTKATPAGSNKNEQTITWNAQTISTGDTEYKIPVKIQEGSVIEYKKYVNTATVSSTAYGDNVTNATYNDAIPSTLTIEKTAVVTDKDGKTVSKEKGTEAARIQMMPSDTIEYTLTVGIKGDNSVKDFAITDVIPDGLIITAIDDEETTPESNTIEWEEQTMKKGDTKTYKVKAKVDQSDARVEKFFDNTATFTYPDDWDTEKYAFETCNTTYHKLPNRGSFDITKTVDEACQTDEEFIFKIEYTRPEEMYNGQTMNTMYAIVTIPEGETTAKVTVNDMLPGTYKVTEESNNWRYTLDEGSEATQTITLNDDNLTNTFEYTNNLSVDNLVSDKTSVTNHMAPIE